MLYSVRDRYKRFRFARACAGIRQLPPVSFDSDSSVMVVTQLQHKDVLLALIALKSFASQVPIGGLSIVNDGSLTPADIELLEGHLPGTRLLRLEAARTLDCPKGGTWERLLWIAELARDHYVIQLDSDTLTLAALAEVQACVAGRRSFLIGTWDDQHFETMAFRASEAKRYLRDQSGPPHVQLLAEANFEKIEGHSHLRYARGCSGFSGFAQGTVDLDFIKRISREMRLAIGDKWDGWGSEQVMSNIVVSSDPKALILPHPKYCDCTRIRAGTTAFVHFIGSCRFAGKNYQSMAHRVMQEMSAGSH